MSAGDEITLDQPLVTLESDKATMDVPAPFAGKIAELKVSVGDEVSEGSVLMTVEPSEDGDQGAEVATSAAPASAAEAAEEQEGADATVATSAAEEPERTQAEQPGARQDGAEADAGYASPAVRRLARELGVDLSGVTGTGRKGRIVKEDVKAAKERPPRRRLRRALRSPASTSRPGRRLTSRNTVRSSGCRSAGSRRSAARTSPATG